MKCVIVYDGADNEGTIIEGIFRDTASKRAADLISIDVARTALPKPCCGCFNCWLKTPGICMYTRDSGGTFLSSIWDSDVLVFVTRILWGGYSIAIKAYADRLLPLLHPYFVKVNGEMHHRMRYNRFPVIFATGYGAATPAEETTFHSYTNAHRDQAGIKIGQGTYIVPSGTAIDGGAVQLWIEKEVVHAHSGN